MHRRAPRTADTVLRPGRGRLGDRPMLLLAIAVLATIAVALSAPQRILLAEAGPATIDQTDPPATTASVDAPEPTLPPIADNEFLPEDANLSDCVGFVERPGCGSEARGGLQQTLIFLALAVGLAIIFWRVSVGVRRGRERA